MDVVAYFVSDRAKVTKGLPDVVAIMEGKVCHCQESTANTTVLLGDTFIKTYTML